jgi:hypothetical protein
MTPGTVQRTTFKENSGADAGTILGGEALDMQNPASDHFIWWLSRAIISFCSSRPMEVK